MCGSFNNVTAGRLDPDGLEDIHLVLDEYCYNWSDKQQKVPQNFDVLRHFHCVGVTYLPGPSPAKYCQHL